MNRITQFHRQNDRAKLAILICGSTKYIELYSSNINMTTSPYLDKYSYHHTIHTQSIVASLLHLTVLHEGYGHMTQAVITKSNCNA